jgi:hypothetical protein
MADSSIRQFKTPEEIRIKNREGVRRYRKTAKGKAANARAMLKRYHGLKAQGLCANCGQRSPKSGVHCEECKSKIQRGTTAWKQRMRESGLCNRCGKLPCLPSMKDRCDSFCKPCYFKKTSIDCLKTARHAEVIGEKLKAQNYRCAYTGELIELGINDSLDHILPISRFPELRSDPANVEWVTRKVNCMKWDSTREEFLETARLVANHARSTSQAF